MSDEGKDDIRSQNPNKHNGRNLRPPPNPTSQHAEASQTDEHPSQLRREQCNIENESNGSSNMTTFSNRSREGKSESTTAENAAAQGFKRSRMKTNQKMSPSSAKSRMVNRAATTLGPRNRKKTPSKQ